MSVQHYENFPVASFLCPPPLRPAVAAIYHYARTADDLADEGDVDAGRRLADLAAYRADLDAVFDGRAPSPRWAGVFEALRRAVERYRLPRALLADLLSAFEQDVRQHAYTDRAQLMDYCRRSADPVGRLLLHLYGIADEDSLRRSDRICTALQLANFWQDLSVDLPRGRLYVPLADCAAHGVDPAELRAGRDTPAVRALLEALHGWTRSMMDEGAPLVHRVGGRAGWELRLVVQGGLRILERSQALGASLLRRRPRLGAWDVLRMLPRALAMPAPRAAAPALPR